MIAESGNINQFRHRAASCILRAGNRCSLIKSPPVSSIGLSRTPRRSGGHMTAVLVIDDDLARRPATPWDRQAFSGWSQRSVSTMLVSSWGLRSRAWRVRARFQVVVSSLPTCTAKFNILVVDELTNTSDKINNQFIVC
jgi:hypothetical protein